MKILSIIVLALNIAGWYGIYTVGMNVFKGSPLGIESIFPAKTVQKEQSSVYATVTVDTLNMRDGPGADNVLVMTLRKGDVLTILERNKESKWVKIEYEGKSGFVHSDYIVIEKEDGEE